MALFFDLSGTHCKAAPQGAKTSPTVWLVDIHQVASQHKCGTQNRHGLNSLAMKSNTNNRDQGQAQEIQGNNNTHLGFFHGVGHTEVSSQRRDTNQDQPAPLNGRWIDKVMPTQHQAQGKLNQAHVKQNGQRIVRGRQRFGRNVRQ